MWFAPLMMALSMIIAADKIDTQTNNAEKKIITPVSKFEGERLFLKYNICKSIVKCVIISS